MPYEYLKHTESHHNHNMSKWWVFIKNPIGEATANLKYLIAQAGSVRCENKKSSLVCHAAYVAKLFLKYVSVFRLPEENKLAFLQIAKHLYEHYILLLSAIFRQRIGMIDQWT